MKKTFFALLISPTLLVLSIATAWAHPGHDHVHEDLSLLAGLLHPLTGVDHLLAALAVGAWAFLLGPAMRWKLPATFLATMLLGVGMALAGLIPGGAHLFSAMTVIALGGLIAMAAKFPRWSALVLVGLFGLVHGAAHISHDVAHSTIISADTTLYIGAMLLSTALLHAGGLWLAKRFFNSSTSVVPRWAGSTLALAGLLLVTSHFLLH